MTFFGATACGLGALVILDRDESRAVIAATLLCVSLTFSSVALLPRSDRGGLGDWADEGRRAARWAIVASAGPRVPVVAGLGIPRRNRSSRCPTWECAVTTSSTASPRASRRSSGFPSRRLAPPRRRLRGGSRCSSAGSCSPAPAWFAGRPPAAGSGSGLTALAAFWFRACPQPGTLERPADGLSRSVRRGPVDRRRAGCRARKGRTPGTH